MGVSLPEMLIVTIIIGLLGLLAYSQFGNGSNNVRAKTTYDAAQKIASSWSLLSQITGVSATIAASSPFNALVGTANTPLDAVMVGNNPTGVIAAAYQAAYTSSGIRPLSDMANIVTVPVAGTSAGAYTINGYTVSLASGTSGTQNTLLVKFLAVPTSTVSSVHASHGTGTWALTAVATGPVQHTADASGIGTMDLTLQFNN